MENYQWSDYSTTKSRRSGLAPGSPRCLALTQLVGQFLLNIDKALADRYTPGHGHHTRLGNRVVGVCISFQLRPEPGQILLIDDADKSFLGVISKASPIKSSA